MRSEPEERHPKASQMDGFGGSGYSDTSMGPNEKRGGAMRKAMRWAATLLVLACVGVPVLKAQTLPPEVAANGYADMIVVNGKIVSMDDQGYNANPGHIYQAMAVKENRILALGT